MPYQYAMRPIIQRTTAIASSNTADTAISFGTQQVRIAADTACWISFNKPAVVHGAASLYIPPNWPEDFRVDQGDVINFIGTSGYISITELSK